MTSDQGPEDARGPAATGSPQDARRRTLVTSGATHRVNRHGTSVGTHRPGPPSWPHTAARSSPEDALALADEAEPRPSTRPATTGVEAPAWDIAPRAPGSGSTSRPLHAAPAPPGPRQDLADRCRADRHVPDPRRAA
ncbi:hypothetical protein QJS66_14145 [Kocuria rhizophila]|nr:hypothetical protein QJS66_14145 [Kocuria rhizophila]